MSAPATSLSSSTAPGRPVDRAPRPDVPVDVDDTVEDKNPDSLSVNPAKRDNVRDKPNVKPPFIDIPMGRFLTYLSLALVAFAAFYAWRVTVWAADAGGYWNLATGRRDTLADVVEESRKSAVSSSSSASVTGARGGAGAAAAQPTEATVESLVLQLADKLGVKPVELNAALRPLLNPSMASAVQPPAQETNEPGLIDIVGEALLD